MLGCTGLLAELGILRTRAGVRRHPALHASPPTRRIKVYDYAVDVDCHLRHRAPAASAAGPVPLGRACAQRMGTRRTGPADVRPGRGVPPTAGGVSLLFAGTLPGGIIGHSPGGGVLPIAGGPLPHHCSPGQRAGRSPRPPSGRGARRSPIAGGVILPSAGQRAARHLRLLSGRRPGAPRPPEGSSHRMPASGPRGTHDCHPGGGQCKLIAGAVLSPYDG
jgi:hypothetical protein